MSMDTDEKPNSKLFFSIPIDWSTMQLTEQVRALRLARDDENLLKGQAIVIMGPDPSNSLMNVAQVGSIGNDLTRASDTALTTKAINYTWNQVSQHIERVRTPTSFKAVGGIASAGATAVWTPAGGKKFRVMGGLIALSKEAACAGAESIALKDSAATFLEVDISNAALVATGQVEIIPFAYPGNGYLSTAADNVLNVNLGGALTAGVLTVNVWGCEE
jgi:hypothetical protein